MPGVGIDMLEIGRLERTLARRPQMAERLFTDGERAYAAGRARPAQHLAARFCAKEAVVKALELGAFSWLDIEVVSDQDAPRIVLHGALADRPEQIDISLSHTREMAVAVAVLR